jgi:hypothetical protein
LALEQLRAEPADCSMKRILSFLKDRPQEFGDYLRTVPKVQRKARVGESMTEGYLAEGEAKAGWFYLQAGSGIIAFPVDRIDPVVYLVPEEP